MTDISIKESIPHRGPMLLVDEVIRCDGDQIVCSKLFRADEFFFQGHYPDHPLVPGVILCECAAQAGAVLLANHHLNGDVVGQVPVLTRMNKVRFKNTVHPGHRVEITAQLVEQVSRVYFLSATIRREGKLAASLEFACTLAEKSSTSPSGPAASRAIPKPKGHGKTSQTTRVD